MHKRTSMGGYGALLGVALFACNSTGASDATQSRAAASVAGRADTLDASTPPRAGEAPSGGAGAAKPRAERSLPEEQSRESNLSVRVEYAVYASMLSAMDDQGAGSIDALVAMMPSDGLDAVLVTVHVEPATSAPEAPAFVTTFTAKGGETVEKTWQAAPANRSGTYRAIITVARGVQGARTRLRATQATG